VRNVGLMGAVELSSRPGEPGKRGFDVFLECFAQGLYLRATGDVLAMSPPLIVKETEMEEMISILKKAIIKVG